MRNERPDARSEDKIAASRCHVLNVNTSIFFTRKKFHFSPPSFGWCQTYGGANYSGRKTNRNVVRVLLVKGFNGTTATTTPTTTTTGPLIGIGGWNWLPLESERANNETARCFCRIRFSSDVFPILILCFPFSVTFIQRSLVARVYSPV